MTLTTASILFIGSGPPLGAQVTVGASREKVLETLGPPTGRVEMNGVEAFTFDRGRVILRDGAVESFELVSEEEAQRRQEAAEIERQELEQQQRERQEQWREEGLAILEQKRADPNFAELPASERFAFWEVFLQQYPEVDAKFEYLVAARQAQADEAQIQAMEERLMAELTAEDGIRYGAPYYRSGFPFAYYPYGFRRAKHDTLPEHARGGDPLRRIDNRRRGAFDILPPTIRERAMPLQDYNQSPRQQSHRHAPNKQGQRNHRGGSPRGHR